MLFYGLYIARKVYGFSHNDLHIGNVRVKFVKNIPNIVVNGRERKVPGQYLPKIIDYDAVRFNVYDKNIVGDVLNLIQILNSLKIVDLDFLNEYNYFMNSEQIENAVSNDRYDAWKELEDVLNHPFLL